MEIAYEGKDNWNKTVTLTPGDIADRAVCVSRFLCKLGVTMGDYDGAVVREPEYSSSSIQKMSRYIAIFDASQRLQFRVGLLMRKTEHERQIAGLYFGDSGDQDWILHVFELEKMKDMEGLAKRMTAEFGLHVQVKYSPQKRSARFSFPFVIPEAGNPRLTGLKRYEEGKVFSD
ncbi:MAG: hypothetical protein M1504_01460 [Candidatus Marsarchaeota archaeon]|nr:hypothetical protein [Candidatus Marsarchaeota archaeon]